MSASPIQTHLWLQEVLDQWNARSEDFDEFDLSCSLEDVAKPHAPLSDHDKRACLAERWAFEADPSQPGQKSDWGTHFGPYIGKKARDGTWIMSRPDIRALDKEVVTYWEKRRDACKHPVLKARYADLLWDLRKTVTQERPRIDDARTAIDAYVAMIPLAADKDVDHRIERIQRALELAISIGDDLRITTVTDAMFQLYEKVADPCAAGTWAFLFDNLYDNEKVRLTSGQQDRIIAFLESILAATSSPQDTTRLDPHDAKAAAHRLARHYQKAGQPEEAKRVIRAYGQAFEHLSAQAGGLLAVGWLDGVHKDYTQYGLKDEADQVLLLSKEKGAEAEKEMKTHRITFGLDEGEIESFMAEITKGSVADALIHIVVQFVPSIDAANKVLEELSKTSLLAHLGQEILGDQHTIARIGPLAEDSEGNLINQLANEINVGGQILALAIDRVRARFDLTADALLDFLFNSMIFDRKREPLLRQGFDAYFQGDHVKAIHVLVPQIEHLVRRLLQGLGRPTNKRMKSSKGVMQEKTLTDILEHESALEDFFKAQGALDCLYYLRVYLTDPRGYNLRNRLSHGLINPAGFSREISDRVIHILLVLSLFGRQDEEAASGSSEDEDGANAGKQSTSPS